MRLKYYLKQDNKKLIFRVLWMDESFRNNGVKHYYKATNGMTILSHSFPELNVSDRKIFLQGHDTGCDYNLHESSYSSAEECSKFALDVQNALAEWAVQYQWGSTPEVILGDIYENLGTVVLNKISYLMRPFDKYVVFQTLNLNSLGRLLRYFSASNGYLLSINCKPEQDGNWVPLSTKRELFLIPFSDNKRRDEYFSNVHEAIEEWDKKDFPKKETAPGLETEYIYIV